jgi:hypothetical protein
MASLPSTFLTFQLAEAPSVGSLEVITSPNWSTATHSKLVGHEIPSIATGALSLPSILLTFQVEASPVGSIEVRMSPESSTPAQKEVDGHDIALGPRL